MSKLYVLGMGPGHPDYILPAVTRTLSRCDVLAAGRRHLKNLSFSGECILIDADLSGALEKIKKALADEKDVAVAVSGDPGFYSLLNYLKKNLRETAIEVLPGISSLSYLFSKTGRCYDDARFMSLHGREVDVRSLVEENACTAFLTDRLHDVSAIANALTGLDVRFLVGENLSYPDERITECTLEEARDYVAGPLCVVVVENETL